MGVRISILKPNPIINPAFEKKTAYSYTWFHRKLTYSYSVLLTYIPFCILCDCGGVTRVILVRMCESVFWNQPQSYTWPLKKSLFTYLISQKVDLYKHCSYNFYTLFYPLWFVNKLKMTLITRKPALCIPVGAEKGGYSARTSELCYI